MTTFERNQSALVISLDFELHWGIYEHTPSLEACRERLLQTRRLIPQLLDLFEEFEIAATWATVGFLFFESRDELLANMPEAQPNYKNPALATYQLLDTLGSDEEEDPFHFAPSLIAEIHERPHQEIGTHTHAHFYCLEDGQDVEAFDADLRAARTAAALRGIELKSLVFPRNQINESYLQAIENNGIGVIRGNPLKWFDRPRAWKDQTLLHRSARLLDNYLPTNSAGHETIRRLGEVIDVPASRFLRPVSLNMKPLEEVRLRRILGEMTAAARNDGIYHLWWHPHNFGTNTAANLDFLRRILKHHQMLKDEHGMASRAMGDFVIDS